jgi:poly-gamma-glutamate synthesis protein (capsule biosynthesis protein)
LPLLINRIDTGQISVDIAKAKLLNPDFIIVFIHWGLEYERVENMEQRNLAKFIFSHGADAIIGSHPHVVQPFCEIKLSGDTSKMYPVFYSLGNFVSNQREQYKDGGIIAELHLSKENDSRKIDSLNYLPYWVWRKDNADGRSDFYVLPVSKFELDPLAFKLDSDDVFRLNRFTKDTREHMSIVRESGYYRKKEKLQ